jgi:hypothetical protein
MNFLARARAAGSNGDSAVEVETWVDREVAGAEAADIRDGDHRALSAAKEFGGGGIDRDVSGGRFGAPGESPRPCRAREFHRQRPEQEDLRDDRDLGSRWPIGPQPCCGQRAMQLVWTTIC